MYRQGGDVVSKGILAVLAALVLAAMLVAGCGGSDDDASGSEASLTKAEYISKANAICDRGNQATVEGYDAFYAKNPISQGQELTKAQEGELVENVIIPNVGDQARQIERLPAPEGDEEAVAAFVDALNEGLAEVEEDPQAFFGSGNDNPLIPATEAAGAYGISHCGGGL